MERTQEQEIIYLQTKCESLEAELLDLKMKSSEYSYYTKSLAKDEDVANMQNIMACSYNLRHLLPLIQEYGFERVNDYVMAVIQENEINKAKELCEDVNCEK